MNGELKLISIYLFCLYCGFLLLGHGCGFVDILTADSEFFSFGDVQARDMNTSSQTLDSLIVNSCHALQADWFFYLLAFASAYNRIFRYYRRPFPRTSTNPTTSPPHQPRPLKSTLPPPNPKRDLPLRRQPPKRKIGQIRLRLEPFLSSQLDIVRGAQHCKRGYHLLLGKVAAGAHALATAVRNPGAGEAF